MPHSSNPLAKPSAKPSSKPHQLSQTAIDEKVAAVFVTVDESHAGQRIDNYLLGQLKTVPKSHIYRILRSGEVRVNKGRIDQTYRLVLNDVVRIPPLKPTDNQKPNVGGRFQAKLPQSERPDWRFIFEDDALLAIDKPAGMAVHGGSGISLGVIEALRQHRPEAKFLELVHRLDRETSGVLLLAKKRSALTAMHAMLRGEAQSRVEKHYYALVQGAWPDQRRSVKIKLAKYVTASGERRVAVDEEDGQESHTIFNRVEQLPGATLLDCDIRTGRTHQIRVHLASLGYPIIGDDKYGDFPLNKHVAAAKNGGLKRMFLHAYSMAFTHPLSGEKITIEAPLSKDLSHYLDFRKSSA
jgi:23S rRNA pseudouridine955/2504/2580 synthase